ncbi:hypothetical protein [Pseudomonas sp. B33.4]|uniref:hypothetical protein n=1 Tax=Pseudomonas sp. B33.4 TaxID=3104265 RepID=UPI002ADECAAA|nr:hypothetical protein [Pseudomonas sp. B33.4]
MAKPPKKITRPLSPDSSVTSTDPLQNPLGISPDDVAHPGGDATHINPAPGASSTHPGLATIEPQPTVTIHHRPAATVERPTVIIHHLPEGAGTSRAASWVSRHFAENQPAASAGTATRQRVLHPVFIDPESAVKLKSKPSTEDGLRYDKHKKAYVEMSAGMVMVGKTPDGWRQTHSGESTPTGEWVEQIPGSRLWREIDAPRQGAQSDSVSVEATDATPGPSKRPRLDEQSNVTIDASTLVENIFLQQNVALDLSTGQWKNWGKTTKPESGESIEIDGLHYPIVKQGVQADTGLVYLQHPGFSPDSFDTFEHMLRHEPSRQPKWALKREGQWKVLDTHPPFEMPTTAYVSTAFRSLSDHSTNLLARAVFDRVALPQGVTAHGLSVMALTFRHWIDRVSNEAPMHSLSDPLVMLPKLPTSHGSVADGGLLTLPSYTSNQLQRLDFDPKRFPLEWLTYAAQPTAASLRVLLTSILQHSGYSINNTPRQLRENALIFHREGVAAVFVLKLPPITGNHIPRYTAPGSGLLEPGFLNMLSPAQKQQLGSLLPHTELIYLVGGIQHVSSDNPTLFIVREG